MDFGDWLWWLLIMFFMIIFFMMLFRIIVDVFRSGDSGWAKAGWLVFLLVLPVVAMLVYVIVRGDAMTTRDLEAMSAMREQQDAYIRGVAGSGADAASQIRSAHDLLQSGAISQAEFEALKARVLA